MVALTVVSTGALALLLCFQIFVAARPVDLDYMWTKINTDRYFDMIEAGTPLPVDLDYIWIRINTERYIAMVEADTAHPVNLDSVWTRINTKLYFDMMEAGTFKQMDCSKLLLE